MFAVVAARPPLRAVVGKAQVVVEATPALLRCAAGVDVRIVSGTKGVRCLNVPIDTSGAARAHGPLVRVLFVSIRDAELGGKQQRPIPAMAAP